MDKIEEWNEHRTKVPAGRYLLKCIKAEKTKIWHQGTGGWGGSEKVVLWFEITGGEHSGKVVPMFLPLQKDKYGKTTGKVPQGSHYFTYWVIANGLKWPERARLKEMPVSKFVDKVFEGEVVDVKPKWNNGKEQPELFHYSRASVLYSLFGEVKNDSENPKPKV